MVALALGTVALSWLLTHTLFALRYAALYFDEGGGDRLQPARRAGLRRLPLPRVHDRHGVPGVRHRTSTSRRIRGVVLRHGMLAYLTSAVVLATAINLVSGLIQ